jgi:hypothetical protein
LKSEAEQHHGETHGNRGGHPELPHPVGNRLHCRKQARRGAPPTPAITGILLFDTGGGKSFQLDQLAGSGQRQVSDRVGGGVVRLDSWGTIGAGWPGDPAQLPDAQITTG